MTALQDRSSVEPERRKAREISRFPKRLTYDQSEDDVTARQTWTGKDQGNSIVPNATVDALQEERQRMADSERQHAAQIKKLANQHEARLNGMRTEHDKILRRLGRALEANSQLRDQFDSLKEHLERHCVDVSRIPACDRRRIRDYCAQFDDADRGSDHEKMIEKSKSLEDDAVSVTGQGARRSGTRGRRRRRGVRQKKQAGHTSRSHQQQPDTRRAARAKRIPRDSSLRGNGIYTLNGYAPAVRTP